MRHYGCLCAHDCKCVLVHILAGHLYPCSMCQGVDQPSSVMLYMHTSHVLPETVWIQAPLVCISAPWEAVSVGMCILCAGSVGQFWSWGHISVTGKHPHATCQTPCVCLGICVLVHHAQMCTVHLRLECHTCPFLPCWSRALPLAMYPWPPF